jgi:heat shock protein HtpX
MKNSFKTTLLLTALTVFLLLAGGYIGGRNGLLVAIIVAALMNFLSYFYSDRIALALYRARPLTPGQLPHLQHTVKRLAQSAGLPMPKIYVIANESPNAFATGRDPRHASIAVTQGLLNLLRPEELEGVLAHELGHVHNRDILISSSPQPWLEPSLCWPKWATGRPYSAALADVITIVSEAAGSRHC